LKVLVTGGLGFIGSHVIDKLILDGFSVLNLDKQTYAANLRNLAHHSDNPSYKLVVGDISSENLLEEIFRTEEIGGVIHLAAESHVDRSISNPAAFVYTNVVGTYNLLEVTKKYYLSGRLPKNFKFLHVSTDEVFGELGPTGFFDENSSYAPRSPYSASKAASDHFVKSWHKTYGLPTVITNCSNNFGPRQYPEKLIPKTILSALNDRPIEIYGEGLNIRDWLHVIDHASALVKVLKEGQPGKNYLIGGRNELTNLEIVQLICEKMDALLKPMQSFSELITFVADRKGHDFRYAINSENFEKEFNWEANQSFEDTLTSTIKWYLECANWWKDLGHSI
jgi:dTDP-glucose 4,6-dehydratase